MVVLSQTVKDGKTVGVEWDMKKYKDIDHKERKRPLYKVKLTARVDTTEKSDV